MLFFPRCHSLWSTDLRKVNNCGEPVYTCCGSPSQSGQKIRRSIKLSNLTGGMPDYTWTEVAFQCSYKLECLPTAWLIPALCVSFNWFRVAKPETPVVWGSFGKSMKIVTCVCSCSLCQKSWTSLIQKWYKLLYSSLLILRNKEFHLNIPLKQTVKSMYLF